MLEFSPIVMELLSPRSVQPNHTLERGPSLTFPITTLFGATHAVLSTCGRTPSTAMAHKPVCDDTAGADAAAAAAALLGDAGGSDDEAVLPRSSGRSRRQVRAVLGRWALCTMPRWGDTAAPPQAGAGERSVAWLGGCLPCMP